MDDKTKVLLAEYLQDKLHDHCSGYMFASDDVLGYINEFFTINEELRLLIDQKEELERRIHEIKGAR